jgi:hypothetical protein
MPQSHRVDATRWARVKPEWRSLPKDTLPLAFDYLKSVLSAEEYDRMVRQYQRGQREVRIENGFIVTCFTPIGLGTRQGSKERRRLH